MTTDIKIRKASVAPAAGITGLLTAKARRRRDSQRGLSEIAGHMPVRRNDLLAQLTISYLPIDQLLPARRRVRQRDPVQVARIKSSIEKFGICQPVLVDGDNRIAHGHGIVEAARAAGLSTIPVIAIDHLTPAELRLLSIALNRLGETAQWDEEVLKLEFEELVDLGEDIVVTGFDEAEIDLLLLDDVEEAASDDDIVPAVSGVAVSRPGDLWHLGCHRLLQGDALDRSSYERLMGEGELARIVLTDEPFNVPNVGHVTSQAHHREFAMAAGEMSREEFAAFNRDWMALSSARLVDGGLLATFIDWRSLDLVLASGRELGLDLLNLVVWAKTNAGQGSLWRSQH